MLLANNIVLIVAMASVLLGTLYPLFLDALDLGKISVGPPYFDAVFYPLLAPAVFLMGVAPIARWNRAAVPELAARLKWALAVALVSALLLPFVLGPGRSFLLSQICIYGVIALSLTVLTGWAGQVSLGQFALVAVGAIMAAHLGSSVPLVLLLPFAGAVTAVVAVLVGLPALRVRGLYLAVSTLAFALFMQESVLATPCFTPPLLHKRLCTGLPDPQSTLIGRPLALAAAMVASQTTPPR